MEDGMVAIKVKDRIVGPVRRVETHHVPQVADGGETDHVSVAVEPANLPYQRQTEQVGQVHCGPRYNREHHR